MVLAKPDLRNLLPLYYKIDGSVSDEFIDNEKRQLVRSTQEIV